MSISLNLSDKRGSLVSIDSSVGLPFDVKRIYYIFGTQKNVSRGHCIKDFIKLVYQGCEMTIDNGDSQENIDKSLQSYKFTTNVMDQF